jgi:hypothetical protein
VSCVFQYRSATLGPELQHFHAFLRMSPAPLMFGIEVTGKASSAFSQSCG